MGHVIFALDTQVFIKISNVYRNLKGPMKLDLCIGIDIIDYVTGIGNISVYAATPRYRK